MTKRQQPERKLQALVSKYLLMALPHDAFFSSLPGGNRGVTTTPGYRSGLPDMLVLHDSMPLFIELKAPAGAVSPQQAMARSDISKAGGQYRICRSIEDVEDFLRAFQIPLRASVSERRAA